MARKEDKQPQYLPLIVKAKLHTGGRDYEKIKEELKGQGFTCKQMKGMVREGNYFDGIVLYLSKWNWDNHESWHLYNWDDKDDFKAVCPLEIGDTVAIKTTKDGETKEALYLPQGCTVITTATVALHKVTDIATLHYLKKGETQFLYELDACGKYEPLTVKVPVREFAEELKRRGR